MVQRHHWQAGEGSRPNGGLGCRTDVEVGQQGRRHRLHDDQGGEVAVREARREDAVDMRRRWRDDRWDQGPFACIGGHASPGDAVVAAGGGAVLTPVCVVRIVGCGVACWFVTRNRLGIRWQSLNVQRGPVRVVQHGDVRLLVERPIHT